VGPEGELYVASGSQLVALAEGTLAQRAAYSADSSDFVSSPVVFDFNGKNFVAASTADGRIHVVDTAGMTSVAKSDAVAKAGYAVGALATWEDESKVRWILIPTGAKVEALKLVESGGSVSFQKGWASGDMVSPLTPSIVNGVVFAAAAGNARGAKAMLYAYEGTTGKELWNSGSAIASYITTGGLSAGGGRVYLSTADSNQYAFGFPMEH